jgi:hypothetical protein
MSNSEYTSVSEIVSGVYCENKMVLDIRYGKRQTRRVARLAKEGDRRHKEFENQGRRRMRQDRRCFIATAIYGADAAETQFLRDWRDRVLARTVAGRLSVKTYYLVSPRMVALSARFPLVARVARCLLARFMRCIGWRG